MSISTKLKTCFNIVITCVAIGVCVYVAIYNNVQTKNGSTFSNLVFTRLSLLYTGLSFTPSSVLSKHWQPIGNNTDVYVYAAYHDDVTSSVQIIAVANVSSMDTSQCVFLNHDLSVKWVAAGKLEVFPDHHARKFKPAYIHCNVPAGVKPATVQIVFNGNSQPMRVLYRRPKTYNFTVCVPALFGPYANRTSIVEMIEADVMFGADKIIFYNYSISPEVDKLLQYYMGKGLVDVIPWDLPDIDVHYYAQMALVQDCILDNINRTTFLVLKDIDEIIVPHNHSNWKELIADTHNGTAKIAVYMFLNTFFDLNWVNSTGCSQNVNIRKLKLRRLSYIFRQDKFFVPTVRSKLIMRPELVDLSGIHEVYRMHKGFSQTVVDTRVGYVHHYRFREGKGPILNDTYMCKYVEKLGKRVIKVLKTYHKYTSITHI